MGLKRQLDTDFWTHPGIADLPKDAKLLYLFLYANPQSSKCGTVRVSARLSRETLCMTEQEYGAALSALWRIVRDFDGTLAIRSFIEHNCTNDTWRTAALSDLARYPQVVQDWVLGKTRVDPPNLARPPRVPPLYPQGTPTVVLEKERVVVREQEQEQEQGVLTHPCPNPEASDAPDGSFRLKPPPKVKTRAQTPVPPECPVDDIIDACNKILGDIWGKVVRFEDGKKRNGKHPRRDLIARWDENPEYQSIDWWRRMFAYIRKSCAHLIGENDRGWHASLRWIVEEDHWTKLVNGEYRRAPVRGRRDAQTDEVIAMLNARQPQPEEGR